MECVCRNVSKPSVHSPSSSSAGEILTLIQAALCCGCDRNETVHHRATSPSSDWLKETLLNNKSVDHHHHHHQQVGGFNLGSRDIKSNYKHSPLSPTQSQENLRQIKW